MRCPFPLPKRAMFEPDSHLITNQDQNPKQLARKRLEPRRTEQALTLPTCPSLLQLSTTHTPCISRSCREKDNNDPIHLKKSPSAGIHVEFYAPEAEHLGIRREASPATTALRHQEALQGHSKRYVARSGPTSFFLLLLTVSFSPQDNGTGRRKRHPKRTKTQPRLRRITASCASWHRRSPLRMRRSRHDPGPRRTLAPAAGRASCVLGLGRIRHRAPGRPARRRPAPSRWASCITCSRSRRYWAATRRSRQPTAMVEQRLLSRGRGGASCAPL